MLHWLINSLGSMSLTAWVAVYGALLATVNGIWTWRRAPRDRGRLAVRAMIADVHSYAGSALIAKGARVVSLTITNVGTKPVHLTSVGGRYVRDRGKQRRAWDVLSANPDRYQRKLEPGETMTVLIHNAQELATGKVSWIGVEDTLGNTYGVSGRRLRKLVKEAKE